MRKIITFSRKALEEDILREARALGRPDGSAKQIANKATKEVENWLDGRKKLTQKDLDLATAQKIAKYDADLSYIFENRDIII